MGGTKDDLFEFKLRAGKTLKMMKEWYMSRRGTVMQMKRDEICNKYFLSITFYFGWEGEVVSYSELSPFLINIVDYSNAQSHVTTATASRRSELPCRITVYHELGPATRLGNVTEWTTVYLLY